MKPDLEKKLILNKFLFKSGKIVLVGFERQWNSMFPIKSQKWILNESNTFYILATVNDVTPES